MDVGCGVGGQHAAHRVQVWHVVRGAITLSPTRPAEREITSQDAGIPPESVVEFKVEDALNQPSRGRLVRLGLVPGKRGAHAGQGALREGARERCASLAAGSSW